MSLTTLDTVILVASAASVLMGLWRGLVRTLFGLMAWASALFASPLLALSLASATGWSWGLSLALSFLLVFVLVRVLGALMARALGKAGLGGLDRVLGGMFGALRALLIIAVLALLAHATGLDRSRTWKEAALAPFLEGIVQWVEPLLPETLGGPIRT